MAKETKLTLGQRIKRAWNGGVDKPGTEEGVNPEPENKGAGDFSVVLAEKEGEIGSLKEKLSEVTAERDALEKELSEKTKEIEEATELIIELGNRKKPGIKAVENTGADLPARKKGRVHRFTAKARKELGRG